jgi:DNA-directed RNA polymerase subunit RPC12/RpoP
MKGAKCFNCGTEYVWQDDRLDVKDNLCHICGSHLIVIQSKPGGSKSVTICSG